MEYQRRRGHHRFLDRVWRLMVGEDGTLSHAVTADEPSLEQRRLLHQTIKKVTEDIEELRFNTAISQMMVFTNEMTKLERRPRALLEPFVLLLAPFAPHLSEELWERSGACPQCRASAMAVVRSGSRRERPHDHPHSGERQTPRKDRTRCDRFQGTDRGSGPGTGAGVGARQAAEEGHLRGEKTYQLRGLVRRK